MAGGRPKHGMSNTPMYKKWEHMKHRCDNPNSSEYHNYGARGITYCDEWRDFIPFMQWSLKNGYSDELQLDRKENDLNYTPDNCQYVTPKKNSQNKRTSKYWHVKGTRYESSEDAAKALGVTKNTIIVWCNGVYSAKNDKFYPPRPDCWSELKYKD